MFRLYSILSGPIEKLIDPCDVSMVSDLIPHMEIVTIFF